MSALRPRRDGTALSWSLALSLAVHALLGVRSLYGADEAARAPAPMLDNWFGSAVEVGVEAEPSSVAVDSLPAEPAPPAPEPEPPDANENENENDAEEAAPPAAKPAERTPAARDAEDPAPAPPKKPAPAKRARREERRTPARDKARPAKPRAEASSSAVAASSGAPGAGAPAAGAFGSETLPPGVRRVPSALARAIPAAVTGDAAWRELPVGMVSLFRVAIRVGEDGRLAGGELLLRAGEKKPPSIHRLVERTLLALQSGTFALARGGTGTEILEIRVELGDGPVRSEDPTSIAEKGFEPPSPERPGKAYFVYGSGRRFEATIRVLPSRP